MSLGQRGTATSHHEVTGITASGFWLLADDAEYFVPFSNYPVFRTAGIEQIFDVQRLSARQFHWPALDADVELDALEHPEYYPLIWRG